MTAGKKDCFEQPGGGARRSATKLLTKDEARRTADEYRQNGATAHQLIGVEAVLTLSLYLWLI